MLSLYEHQDKMIYGVRSALSTFKRVLLQSSAGSGKTVMALFIAESVVNKGGTCFFICHRKELIAQTAGTFKKNGLDFGVIASGVKPDYSKKIQICIIGTLRNRLNEIPIPTVCIWDECQFIAARGWAETQAFFSKAYHIGLSATPTRLSGEGLIAHFDTMVKGPSPMWLIENGYLANYRLFSVPGVNMDGAKTRMGEFVQSEVAEAMDKPAITGNIVKHWLSLASDKLTIGFAPNVSMSKKFAKAFTDAGIPSVHIDSDTNGNDRRELLQSFARGEIRVVFNVALFGVGFDLSANSGMDVAVGCVIDAAPTQSLMNWIQRSFRALRKQDGTAIILDHASNALTHGLPCQDREWTLEGKKKAKRGDIEPDILIKQCKECFCCHKPAMICPECGFIYPIIERKVEEKEGELVEITAEMQEKKQARMIQGKAKTVQDLMRTGMGRSRATHIVNARKDKEKLQNELLSLDEKLSMSAVLKMKPKELNKRIGELNGS